MNSEHWAHNMYKRMKGGYFEGIIQKYNLRRVKNKIY